MCWFKTYLLTDFTSNNTSGIWGCKHYTLYKEYFSKFLMITTIIITLIIIVISLKKSHIIT